MTLYLIIATVGVSFFAWNRQDLFSKWMLNPYLVVNRHQYFRLLTSGFIHQGYAHLGFNMFTFYFFGSVVEQIFNQLNPEYGNILFITFYILAVVVSDIPTLIQHRNNPLYHSLGASGAVSAMVFASILYLPLNKICIFLFICLPGFLLGILYIIYSYYQGKSMSDNINHSAHLTGAFFGVVFGLIVYPPAGLSFFDQILNYRIF